MVRDYRGGLVFIKNKSAAGSGFVAEMKGRKVLITNAHVMEDLKSPTIEPLDRTPLRVGTASVAVGHDLMAFVVVEGGKGIPLASSVETEASIGDAVVVLGNAAGGGVINPLHGELSGIGSDRVEITAPFEMGNSGSPIIHLPSGRVIGVATYAKLSPLLSGQTQLRRFGYRIDSVKSWQLIDWTKFYAEGELASKIQRTTSELVEVLTDFRSVRLRGSARGYESPAIRNALDDYFAAVARDRNASEAASLDLLASLRNVSRSDLTMTKRRLSYDYFRRQVEESEVIRSKFISAIDIVLE